MRVDAGRFVVFLMGCRRCYLQVDSIFSGKLRTGEMSMSFRLSRSALLGHILQSGSAARCWVPDVPKD